VKVRVVGVLEPLTVRLLSLVEAEAEAEAVVDPEDSILEPDAMAVLKLVALEDFSAE
jgi:hypothetical protein